MKLTEVIYVHPRTPMTYGRNIPISVPALIKRVEVPINGYCYSDLSNEAILHAKICMIDIHWFFSLKGAKELVSRLKRINDKIIVICGGITSTEFPQQIINQINVDYVVRGDGEGPLPLLIKALMEEGKGLERVPNLIGKDNFSTLFKVKPYSLTKKDFNLNEFYDIDFFPMMKQELMKMHKNNPGYPPFVFPFILPFRGCPIECDFCGGAPKEQSKLFNRKVIYRTSDRLQEDFNVLESQEWITFYNCLLDFVTLMSPDYVKMALPLKKSRLKTQYEFTKAPSIELLDLFLSKFSGGMIHFSVDKMHLTSERLNDPEHMVKLIKLTQNKYPEYMPILDFSSVYAYSNPQYYNAIRYIIKKTNCYLYDGSIWWSDFPKPDQQGYGDQEKFDYFLNNALSYKHTISNSMVSIMNFIDNNFPLYFKKAVRKSYYGYYYKLPFLMNNGWK